MDVEVEEAVAETHLPREIRIFRNEARAPRKSLVQVLDDNAGLVYGPIALLVAQQRKLADRPELAQRVALTFVLQVDELWRERGVVLVQRDQHLVTERRQRMEV